MLSVDLLSLHLVTFLMVFFIFVKFGIVYLVFCNTLNTVKHAVYIHFS